jgi:hypothetical protein
MLKKQAYDSVMKEAAKGSNRGHKAVPIAAKAAN